MVCHDDYLMRVIPFAQLFLQPRHTAPVPSLSQRRNQAPGMHPVKLRRSGNLDVPIAFINDLDNLMASVFLSAPNSPKSLHRLQPKNRTPASSRPSFSRK
jgi:hypothetical protein